MDYELNEVVNVQIRTGLITGRVRQYDNDNRMYLIEVESLSRSQMTTLWVYDWQMSKLR